MTTTAEPQLTGFLATPLARKATLADARVKVFAWGETGTGKSRLGLSFPKPLVCDLEKSTGLYAGEFDFLVAEPTPKLKAHQVVNGIVEQLRAGMYDGQVETLVIDPITDYLDALEAALIDRLRERGVNLDQLSGLKKSAAYSEINDGIRANLDKILALPLHVVFVCRAKNLWGKNAEGRMDVIGRQPDCREITPYLSDIVLKMERDGTAVVEKSRLGALGERIQALSYQHIRQAIQAAQKDKATETPVAKPATENKLIGHAVTARGTTAKKPAPAGSPEEAMAGATPPDASLFTDGFDPNSP